MEKLKMEFTSIHEFCKHIANEMRGTGSDRLRIIGRVDGEIVTDTVYNLKDETQEVTYEVTPHE